MPPEPTFNSYLMLAAVLFAIGMAGVFLRRSLVSMLLSVEVMLTGVTLTFVAADRHFASFDGQVAAVFVFAVAIAQGVVGLAVAIALVRRRHSLNPDEIVDLSW